MAMTHTEAIHACEFWTTNVAETQAIFSTRTAEVGEILSGTQFVADRLTNSIGWGGTVPRWITHEDEETGERSQIENPRYVEIVAEIERRAA